LSYKNYERMFILLPLMHDENVESVQLCCDQIQTKLIDVSKAEGLTDMVSVWELNLKFGKNHLDCVT
jgi:uncharacterized protein (DUF924 family)